jgi:hypothetical protein
MLGPASSVHALDTDESLVHRILAGETALFERICDATISACFARRGPL